MKRVKKTDINPDRLCQTYGVSEQRLNNSPLETCFENLVRLGYTRLAGVVSDEDLVYFANAIDDLFIERQRKEGEIGDSFEIRCPLARDERFLDLVTARAVHQLAELVFKSSPYILMMQNAIVNAPRGLQNQTQWHRDLNYQHWTASQTFAMNALICIDDFTAENGATVVLPGSHLISEFPSKEFVLENEICLTAKRGDVIVMNGMLYHRAGYNQTDSVRRAVNNVFGLPLLQQQIDIPAMLHGKWADDPFLNTLLGYRFNAASNVDEWTKRRVSKS